MLQDHTTYKKLEADPTPKLQRKMNHVLLKLKHDGEIEPSLYTKLYCSSGGFRVCMGCRKFTSLQSLCIQ